MEQVQAKLKFLCAPLTITQSRRTGSEGTPPHTLLTVALHEVSLR